MLDDNNQFRPDSNFYSSGKETSATYGKSSGSNESFSFRVACFYSKDIQESHRQLLNFHSGNS